jgi:hypothetical protein
VAWAPRRISLQLRSDGANGTLRLNHFWFPGWQLEIPSQGLVIPARHSAEGFLEVPGLAAGSYRAELVLGRERTERAGLGLTLGGAIVIALMGLFPGLLFGFEREQSGEAEVEVATIRIREITTAREQPVAQEVGVGAGVSVRAARRRRPARP